ncbi:Glucose/arabinose dehydrogenase, beta-propeller fold [Dehalogenimonas formicexedens]|uniref:Glucose/arabinose dehydrogenase, beta-propeller fold n=1 Tax=Dehalogenimonas formicexedens TaxID=1839801 RepID=A0A1P8F8D9_9CHLR|nr:PQQ-dependent sugar dehydrogenase [Dehalogenimonas formicexedens]APV44700.1 Glucose/arabinose dehydrogenase, beta-propeller fold [Dehalogenimonas formicexedens]
MASKITNTESPEISLELIASGFVSPIALVEAPDGSGRLFVADQTGIISVLKSQGEKREFLDLTQRMIKLNSSYDERGLLGLAFHPRFKDNGRFFVYYSASLRSGAPSDWDHTSHISEFKVSSTDPDRADVESEKIILKVDEPEFNHNGGQIAFGPDGFLYIPLGDGGGANDVGRGHLPGGNAQNTDVLLGKILRIDVDEGSPYGIPEDNPFSGGDGKPEIFAWGLRNPFHIAFDMGGDHELFAGDAGQHQWEEVDIVVRGGNYGWNLMEGAHGFDPDDPRTLQTLPPPRVNSRNEPLIRPIIEYQNASAGGIGSSVIGGYVYRGTAFPDLDGAYIFGDYSDNSDNPTGKIFVARRLGKSAEMWTFEEAVVKNGREGRMNTLLRSFGQDADGEVYVLAADNAGPSGETGKVFKIVV